MGTEELSADTDWGKIFMQGGSDSTLDEGNGNAGDFIEEPMMENTPAENVGIESNIPPAAADTGKPKNKPEEKHDAKAVMPAASKPAEDKSKQPAKPAAKPKTGTEKNDY